MRTKLLLLTGALWIGFVQLAQADVTVQDLSPNDNDITFSGSPPYVTGCNCQALDVDGDSESGIVTADASQIAADLTIEGYLWWDGSPGVGGSVDRYVVSKFTESTDTGRSWYVSINRNTEKLVGRVHYDASNGFDTLSTVNTIPLNEWVQFALTVTDSGMIRLYMNGVEERNLSFAGKSINYASNSDIEFANTDNGSGDFVGRYDQVRISSIARSSFTANCTEFALDGNTIALWNFDDAPVSTDPAITNIKDVANDQGRRVRVSFAPSSFDAPGDTVEIDGYDIWRRIDDIGKVDVVPTPHDRMSKNGDYPAGNWDYVGRVPARGECRYDVVVPSLCDSTDAGMCRSTYFVSATTSDPLVYFDSAPDSGYSVDNLAPMAPLNLALVAETLSWTKAPEEDFRNYRVYGSSSSVLDGSATQLGTTIDNQFSVVGSPFANYFVVVEDFAGNASVASKVNATGIGEGALPSVARLLGNVPNPFNPTTSIRFELTESAEVSIEIFSANGRRVARLHAGSLPAGAHRIQWDGKTDAGVSVPSGAYYYRLAGDHESSARKMTLIR